MEIFRGIMLLNVAATRASPLQKDARVRHVQK
jgi:hypothetical protein